MATKNKQIYQLELDNDNNISDGTKFILYNKGKHGVSLANENTSYNDIQLSSDAKSWPEEFDKFLFISL